MINTDFAIRSFKGGYDDNFQYILTCMQSRAQITIDAALPLEIVRPFINGAFVAILITHTHGDHIAFIDEWSKFAENVTPEISGEIFLSRVAKPINDNTKYFILVATKSNSLNVRKNPSSSSPVIARLLKGSKVPHIKNNTPENRDGSWFYIEYSKGKFGWVSSSYTKKITDSGSRISQQANLKTVKPKKVHTSEAPRTSEFRELKSLVALLQTDRNAAPSLTLTNDLVLTGDEATILACPKGLNGEFRNGTISGVNSKGDNKFYEITSDILPSMDGGPVINDSGETIGMATSFVVDGRSHTIVIPSYAMTDLLGKTGSPSFYSESIFRRHPRQFDLTFYVFKSSHPGDHRSKWLYVSGL